MKPSEQDPLEFDSNEIRTITICHLNLLGIRADDDRTRKGFQGQIRRYSYKLRVMNRRANEHKNEK